MKQIVVNVIPTYNEREIIEKMISKLTEIAQENPRYEFKTLIVDDNSPDGTGLIVESLMRGRKDLYFLLGNKEGLGRAMVRGMNYATKILKADIVITNEADFSFNPDLIPLMLKRLEEGQDLVIANRHKKGGNTKGWTWERKLNHWIANYFFATLVANNHTVTDHNGAFRAVKVKGVLDKINLNKLDTRGFGFFNYILFRLTKITKKYCEIPATYKFRSVGESKVSFNPKYISTYIHDVMEYIQICLRIRVENKKNYS